MKHENHTHHRFPARAHPLTHRSWRSLRSPRLIRATLYNNVPNLEVMQSGGGYKMLGLLLRQKANYITRGVLHSCFSMCIDGFVPPREGKEVDNEDFLLTDWDGMKYLVLNHQVRAPNERSECGKKMVL